MNTTTKPYMTAAEINSAHKYRISNAKINVSATSRVQRENLYKKVCLNLPTARQYPA